MQGPVPRPLSRVQHPVEQSECSPASSVQRPAVDSILSSVLPVSCVQRSTCSQRPASSVQRVGFSTTLLQAAEVCGDPPYPAEVTLQNVHADNEVRTQPACKIVHPIPKDLEGKAGGGILDAEPGLYFVAAGY